ncbi:MAG: DUF481 domain-containing protein [Longimicrobiales bacterium]
MFRHAPTPRFRLHLLAFAALILLALLPAPTMAQEDPAKTRWVFQGELTSVLSHGNSEALTMGLGTVIRRQWEEDALRFEAGAIRVETGKITRRAVGTADAFTMSRDVERTKTAEALYARARYDRRISERVFAFGGVDWLRNTFAGIDSRVLLAAGGGGQARRQRPHALLPQLRGHLHVPAGRGQEPLRGDRLRGRPGGV